MASATAGVCECVCVSVFVGVSVFVAVSVFVCVLRACVRPFGRE